jgi:hypothetical protein
MAKTVKRAFKYRFYPSDQQAAELERTFGCVRYVYNRALRERTDAWYNEQRRISYVQSSAALTAWKTANAWPARSGNCPASTRARPTAPRPGPRSGPAHDAGVQGGLVRP